MPELRLVMLSARCDSVVRRHAEAMGADALIETCSGDDALLAALRGEQPTGDLD
jgi:hypothetical protein